jgi:hypothetical protein
MEIFLDSHLVFPEIPVHCETRRFTAEFTKPATGETAVTETLSGLFGVECAPTSVLIETHTLVC